MFANESWVSHLFSEGCRELVEGVRQPEAAEGRQPAGQVGNPQHCLKVMDDCIGCARMPHLSQD